MVRPESILIDKQSIYKTTINSLRKEISMVSQETTLFDDTIKNNIKYAKKDATDDEIKKVAKLSFCDEFIKKIKVAAENEEAIYMLQNTFQDEISPKEE